MSDNLWTEAFDAMNAVDRDHHDELTLEQKLKVAEIKALLAIGQELSIIQEHGIQPKYSPRRI
jgi:hypothetical protein